MEPALISGFCNVKWMRVFDSPWMKVTQLFKSLHARMELETLWLENRDLTTAPTMPALSSAHTHMNHTPFAFSNLSFHLRRISSSM